MEIIKNEINEIKTTIQKIADTTDEYLFSLVCFKYFYNNGRLDYRDYIDCFVDGRGDGGIDLITIQEAEAQDHLILIQSKLITKIANKQDIIDMLTKMDQTVKNFQDHNTSQYNVKLKRIFREKLATVEDKSFVIELAIFLGTDIDQKRKDEINQCIEMIEDFTQYQISIIYRDQINEKIRTFDEPNIFVPYAKIKIKKESGILKCDENGIMVNIYASSLKDLFDTYREKGLFEQNFRYFVRNKKIDENVIESLRNKRDMFWFLNNGIIIGCEDFDPDGNVIKLTNFSIINGCQTTTLVGDFKDKGKFKDFVLPCKIVKPLSVDLMDKFISDIAEASNSQKPIMDRDLKSNRPEQRRLQRELKSSKPEIYLEIKRGRQKLITPAKKKQIQEWQYVKNDLFGQIILAFHLQGPGTARSHKNEIFSTAKTYNRVFLREFDKDSYIDMLKLNSYYDQFLNNSQFMPDEEIIASTGRYIVLAIIGFFVKEKRGLIDINKFSDEDKWEKEVIIDCLKGSFFVDEEKDHFFTYINGLFKELINELTSLFENRKNIEKTVAYFFKSNEKYRNIILKHIISKYFHNPMKAKDRENYLKIFQ